jgi:hypothetical protein
VSKDLDHSGNDGEHTTQVLRYTVAEEEGTNGRWYVVRVTSGPSAGRCIKLASSSLSLAYVRNSEKSRLAEDVLTD